MAKKSVKENVKENVKETLEKVSQAAKETKAETHEEISKETAETGKAAKNFFKEFWDMTKAVFKAIGLFFKKLFSKKDKN